MGEWRKGKNCMECYFYNPKTDECAACESRRYKKCVEHYVNWELLLEVDPYDPRLKQHFPEEVIQARIREIEGKCKQ